MFKSTGGAIGDEYKVDDVPYVKEDSKERINPFTGESYTAIYKKDRVALGIGGPLSKIIKNAYDDLGIDEKFITKWRADKDIEVKIKEQQAGLPQRVERNNEVVAAANKLKEGDIKQDEYIGVVREQMPIKLAKEVPPMPTNVEIAAALKSDQVEKGILNVNTKLKQNELVGLRLDIPAYNSYDTWVVSIHDGTKTSALETLSYDDVEKHASKFSMHEKSQNIDSVLNKKSQIESVEQDNMNIVLSYKLKISLQIHVP